MVGFQNLSQDQQLLLRSCMALKLITKQQIENMLLENTTTKEMSIRLLQNNVIDSSGLKNAVDLMRISSICPYCDALNIYDERKGGQDVCKQCDRTYIFFSEPISTSFPGSILQKYGNYQIIEEIGSGSMGVVYKAKHNTLDRYAAVKILKEEKQDSIGLLRFQSEAKAISVLRHHGIVAIYDTGEQNGQYYIAMEYVDGKSLVDIPKDSMSLKKKLEIVIQIAEALQHAHENQIIHRDIKPENIMISKNGEVKITDFGLARPLMQSSNITQENVVIGTPLYMSPEQIQGMKLTCATDIYSLGIVLYELITGRTPFMDRDTTSLLHKILSESPKSPNLYVNIPASLNRICMKAIAKDRESRFRSAKEMAEELEKFLKAFGSNFNTAKNIQPAISEYDEDFEEVVSSGSSGIRNMKSVNVDKIDQPLQNNNPSFESRRVTFGEDTPVFPAQPQKIAPETGRIDQRRRVAFTDEEEDAHKVHVAKAKRVTYEDLKPSLPTKVLQRSTGNGTSSVALDIDPSVLQNHQPEEEPEAFHSHWGLYDLFLWSVLAILLAVLFYKMG